jgi:CRP-like cAMP-binding protein
MSDYIDQIRSLTEGVHRLPIDALESFSAIWQPFGAARKEILTAAGEKEKYLYIVLEGVQRVYYADDLGREATLVFTYAPSFGGVLDALMQQSPSRYYFETLTPSRFLRAPGEKLFTVMQDHGDLELLVRKGITGAFSGVLERLAEVQSFSTEDRFRSLLKRSPHILQLVPHKYLANYLGMDATNFSKLINRVKI